MQTLKRLSHSLLISILVFGLSSCASDARNPNDIDTRSLPQLQTLTADNVGGGSSSSEQEKTMGLQNTALSLGAQGGLSWRATQIDEELQQDSPSLDQIFNFNLLMLNNNVLPPVLVQGNNTLSITDPDTIRISNVTYKIAQQAHFVTAPPTWRDYLWMNYPAPAIPDPSLLPKSHQEQIIWQHYVTIGWKNGIQQANDIYSENLGRLKQDYTGMMLYRKLLAQNMVSAPYVATTNLGITGDSSQLSINDQILRITALPALQDNGDKWQPVVVE